MNFSEFAKNLNPYLCKGAKIPNYTRSLFESIIAENKQDEDDINIFFETRSSSTYVSWYNGNRDITRLAKKINSYTDPKSFTALFNDVSLNVKKSICQKFKDEIPDITPKNVGIKLGELFVKIIDEAASNGKKNADKNEPINPSEITVSKKESLENLSSKTIIKELDENDLKSLTNVKSNHDLFCKECMGDPHSAPTDIDPSSKTNRTVFDAQKSIDRLNSKAKKIDDFIKYGIYSKFF